MCTHLHVLVMYYTSKIRKLITIIIEVLEIVVQGLGFYVRQRYRPVGLFQTDNSEILTNFRRTKIGNWKIVSLQINVLEYR